MAPIAANVRVAVLIFLIGASAANMFLAKQFDDAVTAAVASIPRSGTVIISTPFGTFGVVEAYTQVRYRFWICEAIIVTLCGVAFFVISERAKA